MGLDHPALKLERETMANSRMYLRRTASTTKGDWGISTPLINTSEGLFPLEQNSSTSRFPFLGSFHHRYLSVATMLMTIMMIWTKVIYYLASSSVLKCSH